MTTDSTTLAIANNLFESVANEMGTVMLLSAYSSIAREAKDTSTCILDPQGRVVSQSIMIPMHMNSLAMAVRGWQESFDFADSAEDDIYVMNHPYHYGQHLNDIILLMPIFHEGRLCGFSGSISHHVDIGGGAVMNAHASQLYQEGLILPPLRVKQDMVFDGGPIEKIIAANVRVPSLVIGDFRAQFFACRRGRTLLQGMTGRYGVDTVIQWMADLQDYAERTMRSAIRNIPDGVYDAEDFCDPLLPNAAPPRIHVRITIAGDAAEIDLSGSSDQIAGPINSPIASTHSAVYTLFVSLVDVEAMVNDGSYRPIEVTTRQGSVCDPEYPVAVRNRMTTSYRIYSASRKALAEVVPDRVAAAGHDATTSVVFTQNHRGKRHVFQEVIGGGLGASVKGNGCDGIAQPLSNTGNTPVEVTENETDFLRIRSYELITDSGGEGLYRGGMGIRKVFEVTGEGVSFSSTGDRCTYPPQGMNGGGPGRAASVTLEREGSTVNLGAHNTREAIPGDVYGIETCGGGGWGQLENEQ